MSLKDELVAIDSERFIELYADSVAREQEAGESVPKEEVLQDEMDMALEEFPVFKALRNWFEETGVERGFSVDLVNGMSTSTAMIAMMFREYCAQQDLKDSFDID